MNLDRLRLVLDARRTVRRGPAAVQRRQRARLNTMVAFARANSPYYRELYRNLPAPVADPATLPVTTKKTLHERFDDWVTDRSVTRDAVRAFVERPELVGDRFIDRYTALTTSGTTGARGMFLWDDPTLAVTNAMALRMLASWLGPGDVLRIVAGRGRFAMLMAGGSHFASATAAARLERRLGRRFRAIPVDTPLARMVAELNLLQPAILAPYAGIAAVLAGEQEAGKLRISPVLVVLSAEGLPLPEYNRIAKALGAKVRNSYAATECPFMTYSCTENWLHVNADWAVVEPVDEEYRPTPPGDPSHTVLVTNLANRVQPILRYDIGDSVVQRPDPCPCGIPLPAIRVQGRAADVLTFRAAGGEEVEIPPMALVTLAERVPGIEQIQVVQTGPSTVRLRLRATASGDADTVWEKLASRFAAFLADQHLDNVDVERATEPPQQSAGGKYREVIPLD